MKVVFDIMIKDILFDFLNRRKTAKKQEFQLSDDDARQFEQFVPGQLVWENLLKYIRSNEISERQLEELIAAMGRKEITSIARQVKQEMECECDYSSEIRRLHPKVSANELTICCYVIQGKSSREIGELMKVGTSTITSYRCRLRAKLKIKQGTSLKVYLDSITRLKRSRSVMSRLNK